MGGWRKKLLLQVRCGRSIPICCSRYVRKFNSEHCTGALRWDESEVNDVLSSKGQKPLSGGPAKGPERLDARRGTDGHLESSGQEEADDIFESEFTMLQDLWKFDNVPFPVAKQVRPCATI